MANIDDLDAADPLDGTELVEVKQGALNKQSTTQAIADLGGGGVLTGQYTGTGVVSAQALTLPTPCAIIFVRGHPSGEAAGGFGYEAQAIAGSGKALRIHTNAGSSAVIGNPLLELAADGVTVTVEGAGANGLNELGSTYDYVAFVA